MKISEINAFLYVFLWSRARYNWRTYNYGTFVAILNCYIYFLTQHYCFFRFLSRKWHHSKKNVIKTLHFLFNLFCLWHDVMILIYERYISLKQNKSLNWVFIDVFRIPKFYHNCNKNLNTFKHKIKEFLQIKQKDNDIYLYI